MENALVLSTIKSKLPSFNGTGLTYNDVAKMFLTPAWMSNLGNAYQEGIRISDRIAITYSIGHGHTYTFLNGIRIFCYDHGKTKLIREKSFYCFVWNEQDVNTETIALLTDYITSQCKMLGLGTPDPNYVNHVAKTFIDDTIRATKLLGK